MVDHTPWLVVGLGNPGKKYQGTRHNLGFMVVERWVERNAAGATWRDKWNGRTTSITADFGRCVVLEPQTYMNRSGSSVAAAVAFLQVPIDRIVVVHDEIDFSFGRIAIKNGGGHGGHNGLRDLIDALGAREFVRVRCGVGRPPRGNVTDWLLSDFSAEEVALLPDMLEHAEQALSAIIEKGRVAAMNEFNSM